MKPRRPKSAWSAFTLIELLVVIGIIGIMATITVPAIRGLTQSNVIAAGHRQLMDDIAMARQYAINGHRTVYMVFMPPTLGNHFDKIARSGAPNAGIYLRLMTNLLNNTLTGYSIFTFRNTGDQPGVRNHHPHYLIEWRTLPDGVFISTNKFADLPANQYNILPDSTRPFPYTSFPFPLGSQPSYENSWMRMPYIAFDSAGQLHYDAPLKPLYPDQVVQLVRGSIFYPKDANGNYRVAGGPDVVVTAQTNTAVRVNWLTGRSKIEGMDLN